MLLADTDVKLTSIVLGRVKPLPGPAGLRLVSENPEDTLLVVVNTFVQRLREDRVQRTSTKERSVQSR